MDTYDAVTTSPALAIGFGLITFVTVFVFRSATDRKRTFTALVLVWAAALAALAGTDLLLETEVVPPRFPLIVAIPMLVIAAHFATTSGRKVLDRFDGATLTLMHVVRVPVELVLYGLYLDGAVPELMTFAGRNWDILAGLTSPFVWWFGYRKKVMPRWAMVIWNIASITLLANIVVIAVLSIPSPIQAQAFDQPNVAVLHFPYVWLPGIIVPMVFCAHLICLRQLLRGK